MQKPFQLACVDRETKYSILSEKINTFLTCLAETIFFKNNTYSQTCIYLGKRLKNNSYKHKN